MTATLRLALASGFITSSVGRALVLKLKGPGFKPTCDHSATPITLILYSCCLFINHSIEIFVYSCSP